MRNLLAALLLVTAPLLAHAAKEASSSPKATPAAHAPLSPAAIAILKSNGLDPASDEVRAAHQDGTISSIFRGKPISNSLESLAKEGSKKGVSSFVTSRAFIRKLKVDFAGTPVPKVGYDGIYLTKEERLLVAEKLVEGFSPK